MTAPTWNRDQLTDHLSEVITLGGMAVVIAVLAATGSGVPAGVLVLGAAGGALIALHAIGMVLTSRASGFLNLAQVHLGLLSAVVFALIVNADVVGRSVTAVCPSCTPPTDTTRFWVGLVVALPLGAGVGWLAEATVMRRLRERPAVVSVVASVFLLQLLAGLRTPTINAMTTAEQRELGVPGGAIAAPFQPVWQIGSFRINLPEIAAIVVGLVAVVAAGSWLRWARSGRLVRAAADAPERAASLGVAVSSLRGRLWGLAGLLSAVAAILITMSRGEAAVGTGLQVDLLVRLLAVVTIARGRSLPIAALGAVLIGTLDQAASFRFNNTPAVDAALLGIIVIALLLRRRERLRVDDDLAGDVGSIQLMPLPPALRQLPETQRAVQVVAALVAILLLGAPWILSPSQTSLVTAAAVYGMVGLSLLVLTGWAGQPSLGQFALVGLGGYVAVASGLPLLLGIVAAGAVGALAGGILALPAARLRASQLAVVTLAFALATSSVLLNPQLLGRYLPESYDRPILLGLDFDDVRVAYYAVVIAVALTTLATAGIRRSRTGRALRAARDNDAAAGSLGLDLRRVRVTAFAVAGAIAGTAGAIFAVQQGGVRVESFGPTVSVTVLLFTIIGGTGAVAGPLLGAGLFAAFSLMFSQDSSVAISSGTLGLLLLLAAPGGLVEIAARTRDAYANRIVRRRRGDIAGLPSSWATDTGGRVPITASRTPLPARYAVADQWAVAPEDTAEVTP